MTQPSHEVVEARDVAARFELSVPYSIESRTHRLVPGRQQTLVGVCRRAPRVCCPAATPLASGDDRSHASAPSATRVR